MYAVARPRLSSPFLACCVVPATAPWSHRPPWSPVRPWRARWRSWAAPPAIILGSSWPVQAPCTVVCPSCKRRHLFIACRRGHLAGCARHSMIHSRTSHRGHWPRWVGRTRSPLPRTTGSVGRSSAAGRCGWARTAAPASANLADLPVPPRQPPGADAVLPRSPRPRGKDRPPQSCRGAVSFTESGALRG